MMRCMRVRKGCLHHHPRIEQDCYDVIGRRAEKHWKCTMSFPAAGCYASAGFSVPSDGSSPGAPLMRSCCKDVVTSVRRDQRGTIIRKHALFGALRLTERRDGREKAITRWLGTSRRTRSRHGSVARGVCEVSAERLVDIVERLKIFKCGRHPPQPRRTDSRLSISPRLIRLHEFLRLFAVAVCRVGGQFRSSDHAMLNNP
jgi:hypothetical protein